MKMPQEYLPDRLLFMTWSTNESGVDEADTRPVLPPPVSLTTSDSLSGLRADIQYRLSPQ